MLRDIRYGFRRLWRSRAFTAVAVLTLGVGIGANSTIFSWISSTLLNPLPGVRHTSDLVAVTRAGWARTDLMFSYPDYLDLRGQNKSFSSLTSFSMGLPMNLTGVGKPERVWGMLASANYFDTLGIQPMRGRTFSAAEEQQAGGAPVAVISYRLWQTHFGGRESIVGSTVDIDVHPYTIIGITPPYFQGTLTGLRCDLWIPSVMQERFLRSGDALHNRRDNWVFLLGRINPGVGIQRAREEINVLMELLVNQYPDDHRGARHSAMVYPVWRSPYGGNRELYVLLPTLMAASAMVLLLACVNVANLLLVRSVARRREVAIRLSIGAGRWKLLRQFIAESLILALLGGTLAMLFTTWSSGAAVKFIPPSNVPIDLGLHLTGTIPLVVLLISLLTGVTCGVLPAYRLSTLPPVNVLKEETGNVSRGSHKLTNALVAAQIALSLVLLVCAGLFVQSFKNAEQFNSGFDREHVLLLSFDLFAQGYKEDKVTEFQRQLLGKLKTIPGVESASLATWVPLGPESYFINVDPEGYIAQPHESMMIGTAAVTPDYFRTMRIPLLSGREFTLDDRETSQRVAIVNQAFVDRYWPKSQPISRRIRVGREWYNVSAVAHNSNYEELNEKPQPFIYLAALQSPHPRQTVHLRVAGDPLVFVRVAENAIHELDSDLPLFDVSTLKSRVQFASIPQKIAGTFAGAFGILALILAAVGIYGVIAHATEERTREIGIRMAIGADRGDIGWLVLAEGMWLTLIGLTIGFAVSVVISRFLGRFLFGITPTDGTTFIAVAGLLSLVALAACYLPARRAMRLDPNVILRYG